MDQTKSENGLLVMVVDDNPERAGWVEHSLKNTGFATVCVLSDHVSLLQQISSKVPDIILIDLDSPGRDLLECLAIVSAHNPTPIVMFSEEQDRGFIDKAVAAGVTAYLVGGVQPDKVKPVIDVAMAQFNIFQSLRKELDDTRLELEENQLIERAKRLLMLELNMDEASAYQAIRTQSMDCGLRRSDVAKKILQRHARNKGD